MCCANFPADSALDAIVVLQHRDARGPGAVRLILEDGGLEHLDERDAHAFGDRRNVLNDVHDSCSV